MTVAEQSEQSPTRGDGAPRVAYALFALCALGVALRALHLDLPMRYDETVTYVSYASQGWEHITSSYQNPNNHVFHSLLVAWLTGWLGDDPVIIRLPAFLAGCALLPAVAWVAYRVHGREAALIATALVATSPVLIEFSTNARGYSLVALGVVLAVGAGAALLAGAGWIVWLAWIEIGVLGLYTIPTMAIPWLGLTLWLGWSLASSSQPGRRARALAPLAVVTTLIGAVSVTLYWAIVANEGAGALLGNRFVAPEPAVAFLAGTPHAIADILRHWSRGIPLPLAVLALLCVLAGLRPDPALRPWRRLLVSLGVAALAALLAVRNWGEPRIWQWAVPVLAVQAAIGASTLRMKLAPRTLPASGTLVAFAWCGLMSAQLLLANPVRASLDTGAFPAVQEIFEGVAADYRMGDMIVGDFVGVEPLRFYLRRWAVANGPPSRSAMVRTWVVVNERDSARAALVRAQLSRMGAPRLEESRPYLTVGDVSVYLFGRPAGATDARLLEAIDWHTGVAGYVDDERALALLSEVADETRSPVALAWRTRCAALGCMGLPAVGPSAKLSQEVLAELRELAVSGEVEAAFLLGAALDEGWAGTVDPVEAAAWYGRAAEAGHVLAARQLASALARGGLGAADDSAAVEWWTRAAEAGDAEAQLRLGEAYANGRGVERDTEAARTWYQRALERRHPRARAALAQLTR
jgi:hypothetical protein